jgi:hypothetical protein
MKSGLLSLYMLLATWISTTGGPAPGRWQPANKQCIGLHPGGQALLLPADRRKRKEILFQVRRGEKAGIRKLTAARENKLILTQDQ